MCKQSRVDAAFRGGKRIGKECRLPAIGYRLSAQLYLTSAHRTMRTLLMQRFTQGNTESEGVAQRQCEHDVTRFPSRKAASTKD
jgi:hypothetical protein